MLQELKKSKAFHAVMIAWLLLIVFAIASPVLLKEMNVNATKKAIANQSSNWEDAEKKREEAVVTADQAWNDLIEAEAEQRCARCTKYFYQLELAHKGQLPYEESSSTLEGLINDYHGYFDTICIGEYDPCNPDAEYRF